MNTQIEEDRRMKITYRPWFYDPDDCSAWSGPISSRFKIDLGIFYIALFGFRADFLADQLYDLWDYAPDTNKAFPRK